jgi:purine-binding chemotaxis protein CheW
MSIAVEQQAPAPPSQMQASQLDGQGNQYLTFLLGAEEYGVDILRVQEIKGWDTVTPLPNTSDDMRGVINLRGVIVPIIDLRRRFHMEQVEYSKTTVIVVLKVLSEKGERTMGFVVDAVSDVYSIAESQLRPPPDVRVGQPNYVKSLATVDSKMVILLDIDQMVSSAIDVAPASLRP